MKRGISGTVDLEVVRVMLRDAGYIGERTTRDVETYRKVDGARITVPSHRGVVKQADFDRIQALLLR